MNKKGKKILGTSLAGVMTLTGVSGGVDSIKIVSAAVSKDVNAVHSKIEHITYSLKNNYLGLKNIGQWQSYIQEAKKLNAKLPNGSSKDKFAERINKAESLINAVARVNKVEKSMEENAKVMRNLPQWEQYINLAKTDLAKVDLKVFKAQYNSLLERTSERVEAINSVKTNFENALKAVENLYKEANEIAKTDKEKAAAKIKEAEQLAKKLDTHILKDEILKKIEEASKAIDSIVTNPDGSGGGSSSNGGGSSNNGGDTDSSTDLGNITVDSVDKFSSLKGEYDTITVSSSVTEAGELSGVTAKNVVVNGSLEIRIVNSTIENLTVNKEEAVIKIGEGAEIINAILNSSATLEEDNTSVAFAMKALSRVNPKGIIKNVSVNANDANVNIGANVDYVKVNSKSKIHVRKDIVIDRVESATANPLNIGGEGKVNTLDISKAGKEVVVDVDVDDINADSSTTITIGQGKKVITITSTSKGIVIKGLGIVVSISFTTGCEPEVGDEVKGEGENGKPSKGEAKKITVVENNSKTSVSTGAAWKGKEVKVKSHGRNGYKVVGISVTGVDDKDITYKNGKYYFTMPEGEVTITIISIDVSGIDKALEEAKQAKKKVETSDENGFDVEANKYWVTEEEEEKLEDAIDKAKDERDEVKAEEEVAKIIEELNAAIKEFNEAKKPGLKGSEEDKPLVITGVENKQVIDLKDTPEGVIPKSENKNIKEVELEKDGEEVEGYELGTPITEVGKYELEVETYSGDDVEIEFEIIDTSTEEELLVITGVEDNEVIDLKDNLEGVTPVVNSENIEKVILTKGEEEVEGYKLGTAIKEVGKYRLEVQLASGENVVVNFEIVNTSTVVSSPINKENVKITYNSEGESTIEITGIVDTDTIKLYDALEEGNEIEYTRTNDEDKVILTVNLTSESGKVYISLISEGKAESERVEISYGEVTGPGNGNDSGVTDPEEGNGSGTTKPNEGNGSGTTDSNEGSGADKDNGLETGDSTTGNTNPNEENITGIFK